VIRPCRRSCRTFRHYHEKSLASVVVALDGDDSLSLFDVCIDVPLPTSSSPFLKRDVRLNAEWTSAPHCGVSRSRTVRSLDRTCSSSSAVPKTFLGGLLTSIVLASIRARGCEVPRPPRKFLSVRFHFRAVIAASEFQSVRVPLGPSVAGKFSFFQ